MVHQLVVANFTSYNMRVMPYSQSICSSTVRHNTQHVGQIKMNKSKYRAIRTRNADGSWSDSRKEARIDARMMLLKHDPTVSTVERKVRYPLTINGEKIGVYECDWTVYRHDGSREVYDAKGFKTPIYRIKKKLVKALYGFDIIEL